MSRLLIHARTYARLGPASIARVAAYRLGLRSGRHPVQRLADPAPQPPFFRSMEVSSPQADPNRAWDDRLWWFGWHSAPLPDAPPDWFANPFSCTVQPDATRDWWRIPDFGCGDIKGLWELSRMDWAVAWATTAAFGDVSGLERLNMWLADWTERNPPYKGPNWKCGQEASIRVMHLATAALVLGQDRTPEEGLVDLLRTHLQRIAPTMSYAIGQQNNHGTSEAAALFIGGSFLAGRDPRADTWARKGRRWLEKLAATLIEPDGSFSQYSVTYHRVMLDTYSLAEAWRRHRGLPAFSGRLCRRLFAATAWLRTITNTECGDAPNLGANDGARLLQLTGTDYRDFRPSIQLAAALFGGADAFGPGPWTTPLRWLGVADGKPWKAASSQSFDDGGYHVLRVAGSLAVMRYPRFRYRPSQADALHVDLWCNGTNLLRDAGTFSYNQEGSEWFSGTAAHNTVQFDQRDQMPRLGRFLFGDWLRAEGVEPVRVEGARTQAAAGYTDAAGASHHRRITLERRSFTCVDDLSGAFQEARLIWRLTPSQWRVAGGAVRSVHCAISIEFNGEPMAPHIGHAEESLYYQKKAQLPELSVLVSRPGRLITKVEF